MLKSDKTYIGKLLAAFVLTSLLTGLGGILLHELQELVEKLAFGRGEVSSQLLLFGHVSTERRFLAVFAAGILSALIWYLIQRKNRQIISVRSQVSLDKKASYRPILWIHLCNIFLQVASVAAGSPIGKEGAPRELGALTAGRISDYFHLRLPDRKLLIACGAAAGLAAVYQVPFASVFFVFETLAIGFSFRNGLFALLSTVLAAAVAQVVIPDVPLYRTGQLTTSFSTLLLAIAVGAVVGPLAKYFRQLTSWAQSHKTKDRAILWQLPLSFLLLAAIALNFPELLGNGGALAQKVFFGMPLTQALLILPIKAFLVLLVLRTGAYGGTLTPSFSMGAVCAFILVSGLHLIFPDLSMTAALLLGAAVFLATTMKAPLTAIGLVISFTGQSYPSYLPFLLAVAAAYVVNTYLFNHQKKQK
ncbi:chloride channel protein [Streptococcus orisasini]|uniref:chloride channel protein n=1 Tax=Streptococcus orisasini TaxID=1080071 RepID=UPI000A3F8434|nr:chloride channel protein [Streptococcus orisasini]